MARSFSAVLQLAFFLICSAAVAAPSSAPPAKSLSEPTLREKLLARKTASSPSSASLIFDLPVTYNKRVSYWVNHFQNNGKTWFRGWLEKSTRYMPFIQKELRNEGLPQDLAYMVMIESGFDPYANSHANAVGPWQFIQATAERYGLKVSWWLDERRDLKKSTRAAIRYIRDLYTEFGSWYLVAASYNMGENGLRRQIQKYKTKDFWALARAGALPQETMDYVPKILAAMLISKAPSLYGFRDLAQMDPLDYELVIVRRGTDLNQLADHLGITRKAMKDLNAEVVLGYIPMQVEKHPVRVPRGSVQLVADFLQARAE
jgi:membrane-bound lytic murein transglycosylase D